MSGRVWCVVLALVVCFVLAQCETTRWHQLEGYTFHHYVKEFKREYSGEEFAQRKALFEERLAKIKAHNKDESKTWKEGVNHFTDRTDTELKALKGYKKGLAATLPKQGLAWEKARPLNSLPLPAHVDWRNKGVVSSVKDQGGCGSCWTFATAETVESHHALATRQLAVLSEQQILDCTPNPNQCGGTGGCGGGTAELAMQQIVALGGLSSEWTYPYQSYFGAAFSCRFNNHTTRPFAKIKGYVKLPENQYTPLVQAVATVGPIAISVDASAWFSYESGVFNGCNQTNPDIDHAVQLVGYGTDAQHGDYWLVRNSWSPAWGEIGYIRLMKTARITCGIDTHPSDGTGCKGGPPTVTVCGTCGILYDNSYPVL